MTDTARQIDEAIEACTPPEDGRTQRGREIASLILVGLALKTLDRIATALEAQNVMVDHQGRVIPAMNAMPDPDRV